MYEIVLNVVPSVLHVRPRELGVVCGLLFGGRRLIRMCCLLGYKVDGFRALSICARATAGERMYGTNFGI